jgi:hypothetical protein
MNEDFIEKWSNVVAVEWDTTHINRNYITTNGSIFHYMNLVVSDVLMSAHIIT